MGMFDIFSTSDQQNAANTEQQYLQQGYGQLADLFGQGRGAITQYGQAALAPLQQQFATTTAGQQQLANLLGFGPQGAAGIQQTLQNMPGYQFTLNQGTQNALRNQAQSGQLASGATLAALQNVGQGTAQQQYGNYVNQLMPFLGASNQIAGGIAGTNMGIGGGLAGLYGQQGNAAFGTQAAIGNAQAQAQLAGLTQSGNILGALGGLGALGLGIFSDERMKSDIEPIGKTYDGQTIHRFRYSGSPEHHIGLIAQEVEQHAPHAVGTAPGTPFKAVNYKGATDYAAALGHVARGHAGHAHARAPGTGSGAVPNIAGARSTGRPDYAAMLTAGRA